MWNDAVETLSSKKRLLFLILASTVMLYLIFAPAVNILYHSGEDFRYVFGGPDKTCATDDGFYFVMTLGRPIQGYMDCLSYKYAYTLERMSMLRFIAVVMLGCGMGLLADWLFSLGFSLLTAFFAAGSFFLIPRIYGDTVILGATSLPFAVLLVVLAYRFMCNAHTCSPRRGILARLVEIIWLTLSGLLIFCALLTYPAMTFFFGPLVLMKLLFSKIDNWPNTRRELIQDVGIFCSVCALYFVLAYINMQYNPQAPIPDAYRLDHPNLNPIEIVRRALPLANIFDGAWMLTPYTSIAWSGIVLIMLLCAGPVVGLVSFFDSKLYSQDKKVALSTLWQLILGAFILLGLSSAFFLVMPSRDSLGSRLLFATMAANVALLFWCMCRLTYLFPSYLRKAATFTGISLFFLVAGYQANIYTMKDSLSFAEYLSSAKNAVSSYVADGKPLKRIHFIIPKGDYPYTRFFLANGAISELYGRERYQTEWCSLARGVPGEEKDHQAEMIACINKLPPNGLAVTYSYPGDDYTKTDGTLALENEFRSVDIDNWLI